MYVKLPPVGNVRGVRLAAGVGIAFITPDKRQRAVRELRGVRDGRALFGGGRSGRARRGGMVGGARPFRARRRLAQADVVPHGKLHQGKRPRRHTEAHSLCELVPALRVEPCRRAPPLSWAAPRRELGWGGSGSGMPPRVPGAARRGRHCVCSPRSASGTRPRSSSPLTWPRASSPCAYARSCGCSCDRCRGLSDAQLRARSPFPPPSHPPLRPPQPRCP